MVSAMQKYHHERCNINFSYQQYLNHTKSKLTDLSEQESELIKESFMRSFGKLIREISKWQSIGDLRSIGWISLMFVRSSIKSGDYEFRWDLYDENRNLFRYAPIFYWSPEDLFTIFEEEVTSFLTYDTHLRESLNEENIILIKEVMIKHYFSVIESICQEGMNEILKYDLWQEFKKSDNLKISIEHFCMSNKILYEKNHDYQEIS